MVYKSEKPPTKSPNKGTGLSPMVTEEFHFVVPPEAPVFKPTSEEFQDPLTYIAKIRPIAEKCGICKIKPPLNWQPPFAVDVDKFKFTPRIQRLNELEAKTRVKLNFLDQIAKFWELQGSSLKIPMVERRALDLYGLHRFVETEGGFYGVTATRKWSKVALKMGFPTGRDLGSVLKHHYERILHPFDIFKGGKALSEIKAEEGEESESQTEGKKKEKDYKPHGIVSRQAIKPPVEKYARRSKRCLTEKNKDGVEVIAIVEAKEAKPETPTKPKPKKKDVKKVLSFSYDPLAKYICHNCERGDAEENMLLCDGCDDSYHTFCLLPPLTEIPKGDWRCPKCVAAEVSKPTEAFGFEQARREYTLQQFGEMADQFKSDYFNMPVNLVQTELIEKEFWRIVSSIDEDVTVEYGADLHTMDHGSGFPTKITTEEMATCEMEYAKSSWNLNNLPCLQASVLGHINADISGMKIPWMYVGMCFATFCWHNEDHWSYSINYLHWGEAKTWYGVPGSQAEKFEESMKKAAPELFQSQPDLLHQLVTIMNPNILMEAGVDVFRTDQQAGEFVITFPRAYHAGFNQGYNFAEAVNFAPPDWLAKGRECIEHYSMLRRFCVFSHDELVCKMATIPKDLDVTVACAAYDDMMLLVQNEKKMRKSLLEWGVTEAEREAFELLPDDERQCVICKTTCFLSAVTCSCRIDKLACLRHSTEMCSCAPSKHALRYRYTLDELPAMLERLEEVALSLRKWQGNVTEALAQEGSERISLQELKSFIGKGQESQLSGTQLYRKLVEAVEDAEKCAAVAQQLTNKKLRTRTRQSAEKYKLTVEELTLFLKEMEALKCVLKEEPGVRHLMDRVKAFQKETSEMLELDSPDSSALEKLIEQGLMLDVELPELEILQHCLLRANWLEEVEECREDPSHLTVETLKALLDAGLLLRQHPTLSENMCQLQQLLMTVEEWEEKAQACLTAKPRHTMVQLEKLLAAAEDVAAHLPSQAALQDAAKRAKEWMSTAKQLSESQDLSYQDTLDSLVNKGRYIPVQLEQLSLFQNKLDNAKAWKERTARTFLRKNSRYTLMEALSPRTEFGMSVLKNKKKKAGDDIKSAVVSDVKLEGSVSPVAVVAAFKHAERQEMVSMRELRLLNLRKRANDGGDLKYCLCRRGAAGFMLQCELCKDWFHAACVPLPRSAGVKSKQGVNQQEVKFLCPCCLRSRRPRLETILSLLVSLQKLEVRLPEGEALQCLTERAMNWQDRARTSLATDEIASALAKLSVMSQKLVEAAAREKTEKIISSELKKAAGKMSNPELHRRVRAISGVSDEQWEDKVKEEVSQDGGSSVEAGGVQWYCGDSEHAYSTASKASLKSAKQPPLVLSEIARAELEELMLEGDLLEVSLDETLHIWRILQATKQKAERERGPVEQQEELRERHKDRSRVRARKRRIEEYEAQQAMKGKKYKVKVPSFAANTTSHTPPPPPPTHGDKDKGGGKRGGVKKGGKDTRAKVVGKVLGKVMGKKLVGAKVKRKLPEKVVEEKKVVVKRKKKERESSTESDSDENCAAKRCLKPTGKEVDWVQCDGGCEKWFHFRCLGINKRDIREEEDFVCEDCVRANMARGSQTSQRGRRRQAASQPNQPSQQPPPTQPVTNRVKVEPTNLDESLGLDALLSLASGLPETDPSAQLPLDNNAAWMHPPNYSYDMDMSRSYNMQGMPSRSGLTISAPLSNPPELLLNTPPQAPHYPLPENPIPPYPLDPPHPHHPHYLPDPLIQYSTHESQNYYQNPPPPNYPQSYPQTYPQNPPYPNPPYQTQNYQYPSPNNSNYPDQFAPHQENYPRPALQDSYVLTQLTDSPKTNYPVQSYPISESSFSQPEYHRMFPEEKVEGSKPEEKPKNGENSEKPESKPDEPPPLQ